MTRFAHRCAAFQCNDDVRSFLSHGTQLEPQDRHPYRPFASGHVVVPTEFAERQAKTQKNHDSRLARKAKKAAAKKRQANA